MSAWERAAHANGAQAHEAQALLPDGQRLATEDRLTGGRVDQRGAAAQREERQGAEDGRHAGEGAPGVLHLGRDHPVARRVVRAEGSDAFQRRDDR